jgi:hypothetical protein
MMKKCLFFAALFFATGMAVFAEEPKSIRLPLKTDSSQPTRYTRSWISAGAGGIFACDFGGGAIVHDSNSTNGLEIKAPWYGGGGFAFLDLKYAETSVSFIYGAGTVEESPAGTYEGDYSLMNLGFSLLGKFPFYPGKSGKLALFPLLGAEYRLCLSMDADGNMDSAGDWNALWFHFGAGTDYTFTPAFYFRGEVLYGIRLAAGWENDVPGGKPRQGHGLTVKAAIGYRF